MPNVALTNFYVEQIKQLSLKLTSKKEIEDFRKSMIMEIGSQFSGACATSIADCADEIVRIGKSDFHSVEELFNTKTPIFVGELLFFVENCYFFVENSSSFKSYLLLDFESIKTVLFKDNRFFDAITQLNRVHRPNKWII